MITEGTFTVSEFVPIETDQEVTTALPIGRARIIKTYSGAVVGRSVTQFTSAFDQETGTATYVAMESFEGSLAGKRGAFIFIHAASTTGSDRSNEFGIIVPHSGTGELSGIEDSVQLAIDEDGTHRIVLEHDRRPDQPY